LTLGLNRSNIQYFVAMMSSPLMKAIDMRRTADALALIACGDGQLDFVDIDGQTALICACQDMDPSNDLHKVALALIAKGDECLPDHVSANGSTALIWASMIEGDGVVALAILATGTGGIGGGLPRQVDKDGDSAMRFAIEDGKVCLIDALNRGIADYTAGG
jgi:ankyrin repeat protein